MNNRERLIKLLGCKYNCVDRNKCLEEQADYLLENDVIVLLVKVGQTVYYIFDGFIEPCTVEVIFLSDYEDTDIEVIGNIHDNSEFVEVER